MGKKILIESYVKTCKKSTETFQVLWSKLLKISLKLNYAFLFSVILSIWFYLYMSVIEYTAGPNPVMTPM